MKTVLKTKDTVSRQALAGRLEPFLIDRLDPDQQTFAIRCEVPALSWNRLDLAIKMIYLQSLSGQRSGFAEKIYDAHIRSFSLGNMAEPGNDDKVGLVKFREDFAALADSMAETGFDAALSLVPVARDGSILNGAHRSCCALNSGQEITVVETGLDPIRYNHAYFRNRGFSEDYLEAAAMKYAELSPRTAVALLWPAARGKEREVEKIIGPIVYRKSVQLDTNGAHNLLSQVYAGEPWLGDAASNFSGIGSKLTACFSGSSPLRVLVFDAAPERNLIAMKEQIRALYGIGKHAVHITDTHHEALDLTRLLLNPSSLRFLNLAQPNRFPQTGEMIADFKNFLVRNNVPTEMVAADSGIVLGAYGVRPPGDVDFLSPVPVAKNSMFEHHAPDRYAPPLADLLQDPAHHFHFWGIRFINLDLVAEMKRKRNAGRDMDDLALIQPLLAGKSNRQVMKALIYNTRFTYSRLRRFGIRLLKKIGLYENAKALFQPRSKSSR